MAAYSRASFSTTVLFLSRSILLPTIHSVTLSPNIRRNSFIQLRAWKEGGRGRDGEREGGREGGERERGMEEREGGREGERDGGKRGRERGREGGREGGREITCVTHFDELSFQNRYTQ